MSVSVRIVGNQGLPGLDALARRLRVAKGPQRELVGVPSGPVEADGTSLAEVALWTEFGTETAPERPFMRGGIREGTPEIKRVARHDLALLAEGSGTMETVLGRMGEVGAGAIKRYMTSDNFVANAPSTVAKKGSAQPTIDSGSLRSSITHAPEKV